MPGIGLRGLSVYFDDKHGNVHTALEDVSLDFESGKTSVLIGPSGCGKTTLFNCLIGKLVYSGRIELDGTDIEKIKVKDRHFSYVSQSFSLYPHMTVYDNIAFPLISVKTPREIADRKVLQTADELGIYYLLTRKPRQISLGQAQRVAIARALVKEEDVLLMDEPLSNLDKETSEEIRLLVRRSVKEKGRTMIYATHDMKDALALADFIYLLDQGHLVGKYTPEEFLASGDPRVASMLSDFRKP